MLPPNLPTTTLALLQDRYAFTQAKLLSPQGFIGEAKKRGVSLDREQLELLHRRRVLQPFYRVHSRPVATPDPSCPSSGHIDSALQEVRFALAEGHLSDPANRRFTPWPSPMTHPRSGTRPTSFWFCGLSATSWRRCRHTRQQTAWGGIWPILMSEPEKRSRVKGRPRSWSKP